MKRHSLRCNPLASAIGILGVLAGCGQTLVFGERDGVNLAIRADSTSQPPLGVNFGLDRTVATVIPPAAQADGHPVGEGVNMFAGFQINREDTGTPTPVGVKISIGTQFASGEAAIKVAGNPAVVNQIVTVSGRPRVGPTPEAISADVRVYARALASLTFPQKLKLAEALGLVAPSVSPFEPMISKRLRDYLDQARMSVESFNEFKRIFDESVRS